MGARKLHISKDLGLPLDWITLATVVYGARGSGKTSLGRVFAEEATKAGQRFCAIDLKGDWYGLKSSADGKRDGIPVVVFGGDHQDVPLEPGAGKFVGETVAKLEQSCILDFEYFSKGKQVRFLTEFFLSLYDANREPLLLLLDEAQRYCLSDDTEILSRRGWLRWDEIVKGEPVVCFDLESEAYSYGAVEDIIVRRHAGPMVSLTTDAVDCLVTPDHRVVLKRVQRGKGRYKQYGWSFCPASEVPTCVALPSGGAPIGRGVRGLSETDCRVLGWLITDGCLQRSGSAIPSDGFYRLTQSLATRKLGVPLAEQMAIVLGSVDGVRRYDRALRIDPRPGKSGRAGTYEWYFGGRSSGRYKRWLGSELHRVPRRLITDASKEQLLALFQGLLEGDGTSEKGRWSKFYPGKNTGLADDFQEIAIRLGYSTIRKWAGTQGGQWHVSLRRNRGHWIRRRTATTYTGTVWDVTVPTGAFVARRNGKIFVTGNCPQKPLDPDTSKALGAVEDLVKLGRKHGIGPVLFTQRGAGLNKEVSELCDLMVAFRTPGPLDQDRVKDWLDANTTKAQRDQVMGQLSGLATGTAVFASGHPDLKLFGVHAVRLPDTFDSSATPKVGQRRVEPKKLAKPDLEDLKAKMAEAIERAKADDPKALRAQVKTLQAELEKARATKVPAARPGKTIKTTETIREVEPVLVPDVEVLEAFRSAMRSGLQEVSSLLDGYTAKFDQELVAEVRRGKQMAIAVKRQKPVRSKDTVEVEGQSLPAPRPPAATRAAALMGSGPGAEMPSAQRKILQAVAQSGGVATKRKVAMLTGYAIGGGGFNNALGALRTAGWLIGYDPIEITTAGGEAVGEVPALPEGAALLDHWKHQRGKAEALILQALADAGGTLAKDALAEATGYVAGGGGFNNALGRLRTLELITGASELVLSEELC